MAKFSQNTLYQVAGFDGKILATELVYNQPGYYNITFTEGTAPTVTPVDLTGATIDAQIIRRTVTNLTDSRSGLSFDISDYTQAIVSPISLTIANRVDATGQFTLIFDDAMWGLVADDAELDIAVSNPVCFSGRIKVTFPAAGTQPEYSQILFLLFLIRSDGIIN